MTVTLEIATSPRPQTPPTITLDIATLPPPQSPAKENHDVATSPQPQTPLPGKHDMSTSPMPESMDREERSWTVRALDIVSEILIAYKISEEESEANLTLANDL